MLFKFLKSRTETIPAEQELNFVPHRIADRISILIDISALIGASAGKRIALRAILAKEIQIVKNSAARSRERKHRDAVR